MIQLIQTYEYLLSKVGAKDVAAVLTLAEVLKEINVDLEMKIASAILAVRQYERESDSHSEDYRS